MAILGISAFYHDSAAALVDDRGRIAAAAQEERFTRRKYDPSFPARAVAFCLDQAGIRPDQIERVVFYEQPFKKFTRLLDSYMAVGRPGYGAYTKAFSKWLSGKLFQADGIVAELKKLDPGVDWHRRLAFTEHHISHAASAFYPSPFRHALILTLDGVGEYATTSVALGTDKDIEVLKELTFPNSLGLLYAAFTHYLGFRVNSGEYKMMGLAPYGQPAYKDLIFESLIDVREDGSFCLDQAYFDFFSASSIINRKFEELFGGPSRRDGEKLTQRHMDIAASIQSVFEDVILRMTRALAKETGQRNLCLAGGVALNCVVNGRLLKDGAFDNIWIQPAAGDAGGALGAALYAHHAMNGKERVIEGTTDGMAGAFLGPAFTDGEIKSALDQLGARYEKLSPGDLTARSAEALAMGKSLAWFQGRMEFGPRALGARSILADPRRLDMQVKLNLKIKNRESFRPFAPAVLAEFADNWFTLDRDSPYMMFVAEVVEARRVDEGSGGGDRPRGLDLLKVRRSEIPAVTHVDYSARVQTIHRDTNPEFYRLVETFHSLTGCPVILNTSFNVRGEPIVCTPEDAFRCFMNSGLDRLAMGSFYLDKGDQDPLVAMSLARVFSPD